MNPYPVLYVTADPALEARLHSSLQGVADTYAHAGPATAARLARFTPGVFILDMRVEHAALRLDELRELGDHRCPVIALAAPGDLGWRDAAARDAYAIETLDVDAARLRRLVARAATWLTAVQPQTAAGPVAATRQDADALRTLARALEHQGDPARLWPVLLDGLCQSLRVARAGIFSRRDDVYALHAASRAIPGTDSLQFPDDESLVCWLEDRRQLLNLETVSADTPACTAAVTATLRLIGAEAVLPLEHDGCLRGWLYVGPGRTGGVLGDDALDSFLSWGELVASLLAVADSAAPATIPLAAPAPAGSEPTALILDMRNRLVAVNTFVQLLPERIDDPAFRDEFMSLVSQELAVLNTLVLSRLSDPPDAATEQP